MSSPLVSVIVSAYNRPHMLRNALSSVVNQTYTNLQILVQDDSTNGDCAGIVRSISDSRIDYRRNDPPLGTVSNLRDGYRRSSGQFFCTLNDDDLYLPQYVATMVDAMVENPQYSVAFSDHFIIDDSGSIDLQASQRNSQTFGRADLAEGSVPHPLKTGLLTKSIPGMFALFRRDVMDLDDFPDEVSSGYDYWLSYLGVRDGFPIYYNPRRLTSYRVHSGSQTSTFADPHTRIRSFQYTEFTLRRFLSDSRLSSIHSDIRAVLAKLYVSYGATQLRMDMRQRALDKFILSLRTRLNTAALGGFILAGLPGPFLRRALHILSDK